MIRVLVTGATGFVGCQALPLLSALGIEVHAAARMPPPTVGSVHWHRTDLLDASARAVLMDTVRPTHLLHFAWYAEHGKFWEADENELWLESSQDLAQQFFAVGGLRFVGAGTCAEYDWRNLSAPCQEGCTPIAPATRYGVAKAKCQIGLAGMTGLSSAWGRIFFGFGPNEDERRLVPAVVRPLLGGESAKIGPGTGLRDFAPVSAIAAGFVDLLMSGVTGPVNVASGRPFRIADLASRIGERLGRRELVEIGALPARPGEPDMIVADVSRLCGEVGKGLSFDLDSALDETVDWWRERMPAKVLS